MKTIDLKNKMILFNHNKKIQVLKTNLQDQIIKHFGCGCQPFVDQVVSTVEKSINSVDICENVEYDRDGGNITITINPPQLLYEFKLMDNVAEDNK